MSLWLSCGGSDESADSGSYGCGYDGIGGLVATARAWVTRRKGFHHPHGTRIVLHHIDAVGCTVAAAVCDDHLLSGLVAAKAVVCLLPYLLTGTVVTYIALCIAIH